METHELAAIDAERLRRLRAELALAQANAALAQERLQSELRRVVHASGQGTVHVDIDAGHLKRED